MVLRKKLWYYGKNYGTIVSYLTSKKEIKGDLIGIGTTQQSLKENKTVTAITAVKQGTGLLNVPSRIFHPLIQCSGTIWTICRPGTKKNAHRGAQQPLEEQPQQVNKDGKRKLSLKRKAKKSVNEHYGPVKICKLLSFVFKLINC